MRKYKTVTRPAVPERAEEVCVGRVCDLCGMEATRRPEDWGADWFEVNETEVSVTIRSTHGHSYPESGNKITHEFDICPRCFKGRLIPWLVSQGAEVHETEIDW